MLSEDLKTMLAKRYAPPEWATLFEVKDGVGWSGSRRLDAVAFNLWATRGLEVLGFEIKVDRRDWLRELAMPAKAEAAGSVVDRFYVVAPPDVVEPGELPPKWGLKTVKGGKFFETRKAEPFRSTKTFGTLDRTFAAALIAKIQQEIPEAERRGREAGYRDCRQQEERERQAVAARADKEDADFERIVRVAGIDLRWLDDDRLRDLGRYARQKRDRIGDTYDLRTELERMRRRAERWLAELDEEETQQCPEKPSSSAADAPTTILNESGTPSTPSNLPS